MITALLGMVTHHCDIIDAGSDGGRIKTSTSDKKTAGVGQFWAPMVSHLSMPTDNTTKELLKNIVQFISKDTNLIEKENPE